MANSPVVVFEEIYLKLHPEKKSLMSMGEDGNYDHPDVQKAWILFSYATAQSSPDLEQIKQKAAKYDSISLAIIDPDMPPSGFLMESDDGQFDYKHGVQASSDEMIRKGYSPVYKTLLLNKI